MSSRAAAAVAVAGLAAAFAAGCGGGGGGRATLWVTRDEGRRVLVTAEVPAGLTAMQALRREADVTTRYGGRFVQSIEGIEGSLSGRHDWFWFVNGIEGDRSAAEYRLRDGDVEWWDYRDWGRYGQNVAVVVGAFPEPFVHGYDGERRPAVVTVSPDLGARGRRVARRLAHVIHAHRVISDRIAVPPGSNVLRLASGGSPRFVAHRNDDGTIEFVFCCDFQLLAHDPHRFRFRYAWTP